MLSKIFFKKIEMKIKWLTDQRICANKISKKELAKKSKNNEKTKFPEN